MENGREPYEEVAYKKVLPKLNHQRVPKTLDNWSENLDNSTLKQSQQNLLDRITFESEKVKGSHSESSSRRNSDDAGRAKKETFREGK